MNLVPIGAVSTLNSFVAGDPRTLEGVAEDLTPLTSHVYESRAHTKTTTKGFFFFSFFLSCIHSHQITPTWNPEKEKKKVIFVHNNFRDLKQIKQTPNLDN